MQFGRQTVDLCFGGDVSRKEQPHQTFQEWFPVAGFARIGWEDGLTFRNGQSTETDSFVGIKVAGFPQHALDTPCATNQLINRDFPNDLRSMIFLELGQFLLLVRHLRFQRFLQRRYRPTQRQQGN